MEVYQFNNEQFDSLQKLLLYFAIDVNHWQKGKSEYYRELITNWLKKNDDEENAKIIEEIKQNETNMDLAFFTLIYTYNGNFDFYLFGYKIDEESILQLIRKYMQKHSSSVENLIIELLINGKLKIYYEKYLQITQKPPSLLKDIIDKTLLLNINEQIYNDKEKLEKFEQLFDYLELITNNKDLYFIPKNFENLSIEDISKLTILKDRFDRVKKKFPLPNDLIKAVEGGYCSFKTMKAVKNLDKFERDLFILPNDFDKKLSEEFFETMKKISFLIEKKKFLEFKKIFFIPTFVENHILNGNFDEYLESINNFLLPMTYVNKLKNDKSLKMIIDENISQENFFILKQHYEENFYALEKNNKNSNKKSIFIFVAIFVIVTITYYLLISLF